MIITGPQGSGNHLFAKIFSMHPRVQGWNMQREEWRGHHEEPFNQYWQDPVSLRDFDWQHDYYVTSISCPYYKDRRPQIPRYLDFITEAQRHATVVVAILGRDRNILACQQQRVRGNVTYSQALVKFAELHRLCDDVHFVSHELFYLYGGAYLRQLSKQLGFPVAHNHLTLLDDFLCEDANAKYINAAGKGRFDDQARQASLLDS